MPTPAVDSARSFLPDLCEIRTVFAVVLIAELLAVVIALVPITSQDFWYELALISLFSQWVALTSNALLCLLRRLLDRLPAAAAATTVVAVAGATSAGLSAAALRLAPGGWLAAADRPEAWAFVARNAAIAVIVAGVAMRYFHVQHERMRNLEREGAARVQALQARIRPHFLFNSMNTIASLTRLDPARAERAVEDLAELFRTALGDASRPVSLGHELDLSRSYLEIEALRLGERLRVSWRLDPAARGALVPPLTLQPLVENAVYHGVEPAVEGGDIVLATRVAAGRVTVTIDNSLASGEGAHHQGNRMAQANVRERLEAFFEGDLRFAAGLREGRYAVVVDMPLRGPSG